jgi:hypothetical protein
MEYVSKLSLGTEVSFVVCPIDNFSGEIVKSGYVKLIFSGSNRSPVYKPDGYIVCCNIEPDEYIVKLKSEFFLEESFKINFHEKQSKPFVYNISLKPSVSYNFMSGATILRFLVKGKDYKPAANALVEAQPITEGCFRGKVGKNGISKEEDHFYTSLLNGKISVGDTYVVGNKVDGYEECTIEEKLEGLRHFRVKSPFKYNHDRGSELVPLIKTRTNKNGEGIVYFNSVPMGKFDIRLQLYHDEKVFTKEITMEECKTTVLRDWVLDLT